MRKEREKEPQPLSPVAGSSLERGTDLMLKQVGNFIA